ncbi:hypothetical protein ACJX0J_017715, partial [Zea mays]
AIKQSIVFFIGYNDRSSSQHSAAFLIWLLKHPLHPNIRVAVILICCAIVIKYFTAFTENVHNLAGDVLHE